MNDQEWYSMVIPLKFTWEATTEELARLKQLVELRMEQRKSLQIEYQDYSRPSMIIDSFLYHGDLKHASNNELLNELHIQSIINMSNSQLSEEIVSQRHVLWINIDDDTYTDIGQHFEMTNEFLQCSRKKQKQILVHCQMGVSRSSAVILAYLMRYHDYSLDNAYEYLVQRRPIAEPNLSFLLQLFRYEKQLQKIRSKQQQSIDPETKNLILTNPVNLNTQSVTTPEQDSVPSQFVTNSPKLFSSMTLRRSWRWRSFNKFCCCSLKRPL